MKTEPDFGLNPKTLAKIQSVFQAYPEIDKAVIYGSRAMGNYRYNSDIDLTLYGKKLGLSELLRIENELDDLLLPYKIDLSIFHQIDNQDLVKHIQEHGKQLFSKKLVSEI